MEYLDAFRGHDKFKIDTCHINVIDNELSNNFLYTMFEECYKCDQYEMFQSLVDFKTIFYPIFPIRKWQIRSSNASRDPDKAKTICEFTPDVGEFGEYNLHIYKNNTCYLETVTAPVNIYIPLIIIPVLLVLSIITPTILRMLFSKKSQASSNLDEKDKKRIVAIDTFRGIAITMMIFVNDGAGSYEILDHTAWNGLQIADVIFPWFVWIMGFCIPLSIHSQLQKHFSRWEILQHIIKRSIILFLLGLMTNTVYTGADWDNVRIPGVLQRFAISYLIVGIITLFCTKRAYDTPRSRLAEIFEDLIILFPQWIIILIIVGIHTGIIFLLKVPDCPRGYLGPGGLHDHGKYWNCTGGAANYIDKLIVGTDHMYQGGLIQEIYKSPIQDPENMLGSLTTVFQVFLGVQAGVILRIFKSHSSRLYRWSIWALVTGLCAGILCGFQKEDGWIPVNKNLWSLSFVLVTTCFALILFMFCYVLVDIWNLWSGHPFVYPGMNSTVMYVGHQVCFQMFIFHWGFGRMQNHTIRLVESLWSTCVWIVIAYKLWTKKYFLSI